MTDAVGPRRAAPKLLTVGLLAVLGAIAIPDEPRVVALPMLAAIVISVGFFIVLSHRSAYAPLAEIGVTFVAAVTVYLLVPLAVYLALGGTYTILNDNRLLQLQPSASEVASAGWLYVAFLASFAVVYLAVRGRAEPPRSGGGTISRDRLKLMIGIYLLFSLLTVLIVAPIRSETYEGGIAAVNALPLVMRQFMKLWEGWSILLTLGLRVWLFQDFERRKWIIAAWIGYELLLVLSKLGSRTALAISLVSSFMLYHLLVRPIRVRTAILGATAGLTGFLALGVVRAYQGFGTAGQWSSGNAGGEFEVLFGNVVDIKQRLLSGEIRPLPIGFHLADLLAPFPSQILPFEKFDPAVWYIQSFYPEAAERGAGLAFGVIPQSLVGFGWIELMVRGAILGYAFASLHRYFSRHADRFWAMVLYVWITVWCYQSFRNQSFILVMYIVQWFLPLVLVVEGGIRVLRQEGTPSPATPVPLPAGHVTDPS